ncbi:MAG: exodeoxyribonuclease III [Omnitrophica bacterium RIFCSPHIGHO2_02_FULL_46_11]|nr:MAG: exodeoxyribonuclease III [Omnitrophica bacterium RIFCSPLOWO2_01_FULL_45_10b]OGW87954.1 MAG: exodeoxyribonuclease III [Omnitrophica bacterium RIFCSPHIGHO2_02_FULL_46_11]
MKIVSWNVNGIRAAQKKGFLDWLAKESPDVVCVQETKALPSQLDSELLNPQGYHAFFNSAERKGYSGVATFTKKKPISVKTGFGVNRFDIEGRVLVTEYPEFTVLNIYFPNGKKDDIRLQYKLDFYEETLRFVEKLKADGKRVIVSGDYNTAHKPVDLARPKENEDVSGFLPIERAWIDKWIKHGQVDVFRQFCPLPDQYTWWDMKTGARERNVGWRIDYHFVTKDLLADVKDVGILNQVTGSDHCPVSLELKI